MSWPAENAGPLADITTAFRQTVARGGPVQGQHRDAADFFTQQDRRLRRRRTDSLGGHEIFH